MEILINVNLEQVQQHYHEQIENKIKACEDDIKKQEVKPNSNMLI